MWMEPLNLGCLSREPLVPSQDPIKASAMSDHQVLRVTDANSMLFYKVGEQRQLSFRVKRNDYFA
jgi:hypothetical protein